MGGLGTAKAPEGHHKLRVGIISAKDAPSQSFPMALAFSDMRRAALSGGLAAPSFEQAWHVEQVLEAIRRSTVSRRWETCEIG